MNDGGSERMSKPFFIMSDTSCLWSLSFSAAMLILVTKSSTESARELNETEKRLVQASVWLDSEVDSKRETSFVQISLALLQSLISACSCGVSVLAMTPIAFRSSICHFLTLSLGSEPSFAS